MTNGKELAKVEENMTFDQLREQADILIKSKFLPNSVTTAEQAVAIIMTGKELGMRAMESFRSINVIQGKPTLSAQALLALCYRTKEVESASFEKETESEAIFLLKRKGSPVYRSVFTIEDARKLGLSDKDNYKKQPKTMLGWRAISRAARAVFPDATLGLYTPDEIESDAVLLNPSPAGPQQEVVAPPKADQQQVEQIRESLPPFTGAQGLIDPAEVHRIGGLRLKPPYEATTAGKTILEIYNTVTPSGVKKGIKFLEMVAQSSKDADEKAHVQQFLEAMKAQEAQAK